MQDCEEQILLDRNFKIGRLYRTTVKPTLNFCHQPKTKLVLCSLEIQLQPRGITPKRRRILSRQVICGPPDQSADNAADADPIQPDVIALKPRVVVILAGTKDIGGVTGLTYGGPSRTILLPWRYSPARMLFASSCHPYSRPTITAAKMANPSCIARTARLNKSEPSMSG